MFFSKLNALLLIGASLCLSFLLAEQAQAAAPCDPTTYVCVDQPCETLGASQMDKDGKNIIVCLNPETGTQKIWRSSAGTQTHGYGTWAGYCAHGWGGVDHIGTSTAPSYYDPAAGTGNAQEKANAASHGWIIRKGCSCPTGWTVRTVGTCNFGYCADPAHGGSITGEIYMTTCVKNP